jgi:hypothetical protein
MLSYQEKLKFFRMGAPSWTLSGGNIAVDRGWPHALRVT